MIANFRILMTTILLSTSLLGSFELKASTFPLSENSWKNPEFVNRFLGTYSLDTRTEPMLFPADAEFLKNISVLMIDESDRALTQIEARLERNPNAVFYFVYAQILLQKQRDNEAIAAYKSAIKLFPNFSRAYQNLATAYIAKNDCDNAIKHLLKVSELGRSNGTVMGYLGYCYSQSDQFDKALNLYRMANVLQPENYDWQSGIIQSLIAMNRGSEALHVIDQALGNHNKDHQLLYLQAKIYVQENRFLDASRNLEYLRRVSQLDIDGLFLLGDLYIELQVYELALNTYLDGLKSKHTQNAEVVLRKFQKLSNAGAWIQAAEFYKQVKQQIGELNKKDLQLTLELLQAQVLHSQGKPRKALDRLETILNKEPLHSQAVILAAKYNEQLSSYDRAALYFERAEQFEDTRYEALLGQGRILVRENELQKALSAFEKAYKITSNPHLLDYINTLKQIQFEDYAFLAE